MMAAVYAHDHDTQAASATRARNGVLNAVRCPVTQQRGHALRMRIEAKVAHLLSKLTSVRDDDARHLAVLGLDLVQHGQNEHSRLANTGFSLTEDILPLKSYWDALLLNCTYAKSFSRWAKRHTQCGHNRSFGDGAAAPADTGQHVHPDSE
jgi:hypothetical protein